MPGVIASTIVLKPWPATERERERKYSRTTNVYDDYRVVHTAYEWESKLLIQLESSERTWLWCMSILQHITALTDIAALKEARTFLPFYCVKN